MTEATIIRELLSLSGCRFDIPAEWKAECGLEFLTGFARFGSNKQLRVMVDMGDCRDPGLEVRIVDEVGHWQSSWQQLRCPPSHRRQLWHQAHTSFGPAWDHDFRQTLALADPAEVYLEVRVTRRI